MSSLKVLARHMRKAPPRPRNQPEPKPPPVPHHSVYADVDSWDPKYRDPRPSTPASEAPLRKRKEGKKVPEMLEARPATPAAHSKKRTRSLSVAVSEEEEHIIRAYLYKERLSFSVWARSVLFRAMNKPVPARD